jgi:predicted metal-dependent phosphoesterase TrpH
MLIDLHVHSSESDGSFSVESLIDYAIEKGLGALALCDHDTTSGLRRFVSYGKQKSIRAIPGVEISAAWEKGNCHILGLGVQSHNGPLEDALSKIRDSRDNRNGKIIAKLNRLGIDITLKEAESLAGGDVVGRPHMARIMREKGLVASVQEAFDRYLAKGAPAYVDRYRLEPSKAVALLHQAAHLVVLAHPSQLCLSPEKLETFIASLVPHGLGAIEAYTPYDRDDAHGIYLALASKYNLAVTGGSDFHGESKPDHRLGYYGDNLPIPEECFDLFC